MNLMEVSFHKARLRLELPLDTLKRAILQRPKKVVAKHHQKSFVLGSHVVLEQKMVEYE